MSLCSVQTQLSVENVEAGQRRQKWMYFCSLIICIQQNYSAAATNETLAGRVFKTCDGALR